MGAQREPACLCSHALAWSSPHGPFCSLPPWPCHGGFSAEGRGSLRPPGGSGPWPRFDGRPVGSQLRRLHWLAAPSPYPSTVAAWGVGTSQQLRLLSSHRNAKHDAGPNPAWGGLGVSAAIGTSRPTLLGWATLCEW